MFNELKNEKKCPICGKIFYPSAMWVYKFKNYKESLQYYCSYSCLNKGKKKMNDIHPRTRKRGRWKNGS